MLSKDIILKKMNINIESLTYLYHVKEKDR